jgi:hypothetical protein
MPYPESCPECGGAFRNTGTHYTARRNEVGRHILLELGCQNTSRRYWWDFTSGVVAEDGTAPGRRSVLNGGSANGAAVITLERPEPPTTNGHPLPKDDPFAILDGDSPAMPAPEMQVVIPPAPILPGTEPRDGAPRTTEALKETFVRQLQLDRLTLRQMRSWLMTEEARRAIEVAAGATEATYERLALILFGLDLPRLLGKESAPPANPGMSAEERLELQREKARIRARLRRAAAKAARSQA